MESDEYNSIQRRLRPGSIDVHPSETAIVINYELEASVVGDLGDTMLEESRECQKIVRLKSLNETTDVNLLATEIIQKCNLITPSKFKELTTLLLYLRNRKSSPITRPQTAFTDNSKMSIDRPDSDVNLNEEALINKLDEYIELLYEELSDKIKSSWLILQLSRSADNLLELTSNETLICALARVLREDGRKSLELATNIVYIFSSFSNYSQFHSAISQFKVGAICFDLVECELTREESWHRELKEKKSLADSQYNLTTQSDYEKSLKKYQLLVKKQNNFLRICFYLLLNLSEDSKTELKMVNKGIISLLVKALDRDSQDLLQNVVLFLRKLSIYIENKNQMKELTIIEKLTPLLSSTNEKLVSNTLRLFHNLVFDLQLRTIVIKIGLIPKLITFLAKDRHTKTVINILYQISREDKWKVVFSYSTDCINLIISKIVESNSNYNEMTALAINLAINQRIAQIICDNENFIKLMNKAITTNDPLLLKIMRNISHHDDPIKMLFLDHCDKFVQITTSSDTEEVVVECLAILSNLTLTQIDWCSIFNKYSLFSWIKLRLTPGNAFEDDLILQIVIFVSTAVIQKDCALYLLDNNIIKLLIDLLNAKQEDDEMVTQIIYTFYAFLKHSESREHILKVSEIPAYLIDLMNDSNKEIKKVCISTLDVIAEYDNHWSSRIKEEKFCAHNKEWIKMIKCENNEDEKMSDSYGNVLDESFAYPELLLKTDLLNDSSSDNLSDDHSVQGMSISKDASPNRFQTNHHFNSTQTVNVITSKRPQTGYKKRSTTALLRTS